MSHQQGKTQKMRSLSVINVVWNISQKIVLPSVKCVTIKAKGIAKKIAELEYEDYDFDGVETQNCDQSDDSNWYSYDSW